MDIRPYSYADSAALWQILEPVIRAGETLALPRDMCEAEAIAMWTGADRETFVAEEDGQIVGSYYVKANQSGGGAHVANCGYAAAGRRGVGRSMCEHSLLHARDKGFTAMQFNFVVSTNVRAVRLWESFSFEILCRLPGAFLHPTEGYVDALVMFRTL